MSKYDDEVVITITGESARDMIACGERDMRYFLTEEHKIYITPEDLKSIRFVSREKKQKQNSLTVQKRIVGKGAFDKL